jgi:hypothetical protein
VTVSGAAAATASVETTVASKVLNDFGPQPVPDKRPPGWIAIEKVTDGCGQEGSAFRAHDQVYTSTDGQKLKVDFTDACDLHDAAYSGALVWDRINGQFIDFSDPYWTKERINDKFRLDLQRMCFRNFPPVQDATGPRWKTAFETCLGSDELNSTLIRGKTWGALSWHRAVLLSGVNPRKRVDLAGKWKNTALGFPLCDIGAAHPMTITQGRIEHNARFEPTGGREVVAEWIHGTGGYVGKFKGTLITGDQEGDDVVVGTFTVTEGGNKVGGGPMTIKITSEDRFDFNGTGQGGTMVRQARSTQGLLLSIAKPRCEKSGTSQQPKPKGAAGSFVLTGSRVVENPYGKEVTIDTGGNASWNRCCDGATWKTQYTWKVPSTLIPGKPFSISISLKTLEVVPRQPLLDQMSALAPDFRQDLQTQYIGHPSNSKTYSVPFSEGFRTDPNIKEVKVYISFAHASVEYTYRRVGG